MHVLIRVLCATSITTLIADEYFIAAPPAGLVAINAGRYDVTSRSLVIIRSLWSFDCHLINLLTSRRHSIPLRVPMRAHTRSRTSVRANFRRFRTNLIWSGISTGLLDTPTTIWWQSGDYQNLDTKDRRKRDGEARHVTRRYRSVLWRHYAVRGRVCALGAKRP